MIRVGLMGFGKAGQAVASVLQQQPIDALRLLHSQQRGFYTFEELLLGQIKQELLKDAPNRS